MIIYYINMNQLELIGGIRDMGHETVITQQKIN
jgi:hypothetical protein